MNYCNKHIVKLGYSIPFRKGVSASLFGNHKYITFVDTQIQRYNKLVSVHKNNNIRKTEISSIQLRVHGEF